MCLIAFAIGASQRWPLVIASNRDEFLSRPALRLTRWQTASGQEIISGRDLRAGGTWLGMTPGGRVAFLTNVREAEPKTAPCSRGELVTRWLETGGDVESFTAALEKDGQAYGGFNLVLGDFQRNNWAWVTNKSATTVSGWQVQTLQPGVYGLSNAALDTPWPKTMELKRVLTAALAEEANAPSPDALQLRLWTALVNRELTRLEKLPATGVSLAIEEAMSRAFVDFPEHAYATRSSTVLLASRTETSWDSQCWEFQVDERTNLHEKSDETAKVCTSSTTTTVLNFSFQ